MTNICLGKAPAEPNETSTKSETEEEEEETLGSDYERAVSETDRERLERMRYAVDDLSALRDDDHDIVLLENGTYAEFDSEKMHGNEPVSIC